MADKYSGIKAGTALKCSGDGSSETPEYHLALLRRDHERRTYAPAAVRRAYELVDRTRSLIGRSRRSPSF